jgi:hypothetical protein
MAGSFHSANATVSAHSATAVIPSDATIIPVTRGLYIGGTGDVSVVMADDENTITFIGVPAGIFPVQVMQVLATGTSATNIVALY